jgi:hypothetical protein
MAIYKKLTEHYGEEALCFPTVTYERSQLVLDRKDVKDADRPRRFSILMYITELERNWTKCHTSQSARLLRPLVTCIRQLLTFLSKYCIENFDIGGGFLTRSLTIERLHVPRVQI